MTFFIPAALREFAGDRSSIEIECESAILNVVLEQLWQVYPGLRDRIVTEQGHLRTHINIFIGDENIRYLGGLAASVPADAAISIIPAVSGGCLQASAYHSNYPGNIIFSANRSNRILIWTDRWIQITGLQVPPFHSRSFLLKCREPLHPICSQQPITTGMVRRILKIFPC